MINRKLTHTETQGIYNIMNPDRNTDGLKVLRPGDTLLMGRTCYGIHDVCSYSIENGRCPMAAYEREKERGHPLVWVNEKAASLSANREPQKEVIRVDLDEPFEYLGNVYRVTVSNRFGDLKLEALDSQE